MQQVAEYFAFNGEEFGAEAIPAERAVHSQRDDADTEDDKRGSC